MIPIRRRKGSVCPKKNWKSARTRAAIARLQRTASTVALTVRALPGDRPSRATVVTRNVRLPRIDGRFAECSMERTAAPATLGCVHPAGGAAENSFHRSRHRLSVWCLFLNHPYTLSRPPQLGKSLARQIASRFDIRPISEAVLKTSSVLVILLWSDAPAWHTYRRRRRTTALIRCQ